MDALCVVAGDTWSDGGCCRVPSREDFLPTALLAGHGDFTADCVLVCGFRREILVSAHDIEHLRELYSYRRFGVFRRSTVADQPINVGNRLLASAFRRGLNRNVYGGMERLCHRRSGAAVGLSCRVWHAAAAVLGYALEARLIEQEECHDFSGT